MSFIAHATHSDAHLVMLRMLARAQELHTHMARVLEELKAAPDDDVRLLVTFLNSLYRVMHWSDSNYIKRTMVLHTVLVANVFSSIVPPRTRTLTYACPSFDHLVRSEHRISNGQDFTVC
jgi:hypothetical protein